MALCLLLRFGLGLAGIVHLCSTQDRPRQLEGWVLNHLSFIQTSGSEYLHTTSPCDLGFHTTWCLSFKGEHPRERNPGGSCITISNLAWEVTLHHLHHFLFVGVATSLPRLKRWRNRFQLLMGNGKVPEQYIGLEILLWLFLENTSCHRLLLA